MSLFLCLEPHIWQEEYAVFFPFKHPPLAVDNNHSFFSCLNIYFTFHCQPHIGPGLCIETATAVMRITVLPPGLKSSLRPLDSPFPWLMPTTQDVRLFSFMSVMTLVADLFLLLLLLFNHPCQLYSCTFTTLDPSFLCTSMNPTALSAC